MIKEGSFFVVQNVIPEGTSGKPYTFWHTSVTIDYLVESIESIVHTSMRRKCTRLLQLLAERKAIKKITYSLIIIDRIS